MTFIELSAVQDRSAIISEVVDSFRGDYYAGKYADESPIRAQQFCFNAIVAALHERGYKKTDMPISATLGDIDKLSMGTSLGEPDPLENGFRRIFEDLALDARGEKNAQRKQVELEIEIGYQDRGIRLESYDVEARGKEESRNLIRDEARAIGIDVGTEGVWMADGGMGALHRIFRSRRKVGHRASILFAPSPCFAMATAAAEDTGIQIEHIDTTDLPNLEVTSEALQRRVDETRLVPDIMLLTPAENPIAHSYDPENLRQVLLKLDELNPDYTIVFDMAYMSMLPPGKAEAIMKIIYDTHADSHAMYAFSESKRLARPGDRIGAVVITDPARQQRFQKATMRTYPGFGVRTDIGFQSLMRVIDQKDIDKYIALLRQRQQALTETLRDLDPEHRYFKNLDKIRIPGYNQPGEESIEQDVPLYVWLELQDGVDAFEALKITGIVGVPGSAFRGTDKFLRYSLGMVSTSDILRQSPTTLQRWLNH